MRGEPSELYRVPGPNHPTTIRMKSRLFYAQGILMICSIICLLLTVIVFCDALPHYNHRAHEPRVHHLSRCEDCLANGEDYCINDGRCTERATRTCDGPEDHITGSSRFAKEEREMGFPSVKMTCPGVSQDCLGLRQWGEYSLSNSGAADCVCGQMIFDYAECERASFEYQEYYPGEEWGLHGPEDWDGPSGCHIQDGSNFQFNLREHMGSARGHTPVCKIGKEGALHRENYSNYVGCFNHQAGGDTATNFPDAAEIGVSSAQECSDICMKQEKAFFGLTDPDCGSEDRAREGGLADCHCGDTVPWDQYDDSVCLVCNNSDGKPFPCGRCGWKLSVYKVGRARAAVKHSQVADQVCFRQHEEWDIMASFTLPHAAESITLEHESGYLSCCKTGPCDECEENKWGSWRGRINVWLSVKGNNKENKDDLVAPFRGEKAKEYVDEHAYFYNPGAGSSVMDGGVESSKLTFKDYFPAGDYKIWYGIGDRDEKDRENKNKWGDACVTVYSSTTGGPCGCEENGVKFCNFDFELGDERGHCEPCPYDQGGDDPCSHMGLPGAGVTDCRKRCYDDKPRLHPRSRCEDCLANGKDYCINDGRCIERGMRMCDGPEDHVTGSSQFSKEEREHGYPGSMTCPGVGQKRSSQSFVLLHSAHRCDEEESIYPMYWAWKGAEECAETIRGTAVCGDTFVHDTARDPPSCACVGKEKPCRPVSDRTQHIYRLDGPCGCEEDGVKFCNFDYGATGFCELCSDFEDAVHCSSSNSGLPQAGAADCESRCFGKAGTKYSARDKERIAKDLWNEEEWKYKKAAEGKYFNDKWHSATGDEEFAFTCEVDTDSKTATHCADRSWLGPFEGSCYKSFKKRVTHKQARQLCPLNCGMCANDPYLVRITSEKENRRVHRSCGARQSCWIGVQFNVSSNSWFVEGEDKSANFTNWSTGQPQSASDGLSYHHAYISAGPKFEEVISNNAAAIVLESGDMGDKFEKEEDVRGEDAEYAKYNNRWHDLASDDSFPFPYVCESPLNANGTCPDSSWHLFRNSCYRKGPHRVTFTSAQSRCSSEVPHGHLVSIDSDEENNYVWAVCGKGQNPCWIGLYLAPGAETWRWKSGERHEYSHWAEGEPNSFWMRGEGMAGAALMGFNHEGENREYYDATWYDAPKYLRIPFVCEANMASGATECPRMWKGPYTHLSVKSCYKFVPFRKTIREARIYCAKGYTGGYLVSIQSMAENDRVSELCGGAERDHPCWIGLTEAKDSEVFKWETGEPITYENWQEGEPNNFEGIDEDAVFMGFSWDFFEEPFYGPRWHDGPDDLYLPFVCEVETKTSSCPDASWRGTLPSRAGTGTTSCYKLIKQKEYQSGAFRKCEKEHKGAHLVTIESEEENLIVHELGMGKFPMWIGLVEREETEGWYWLNQGPKVWPGDMYVNWDEGQPDNYDGTEETATFMGWHWDYFEMGEHARADTVGSRQPEWHRAWAAEYNDGDVYDSLWYDAEPWMYLPFVCEHRLDEGSCPHDWTLWHGSCYKLFDEVKEQFWDADEKCKSASPGGHLTTISSERENGFVHSVCGGRFPCWIGLREKTNSNDEWEWGTAESVGYTKWSPGCPNKEDPHERAVFMGFSYRYWKAGEASEPYWVQEDEEWDWHHEPEYWEWEDDPMYFENVMLSCTICNFAWASLLFCLWKTFLPRKNATGMSWALLIEMGHCFYTIMFCLGAAWMAEPFWRHTTDVWRVWFATVPLLFLLQFLSGGYTIRAALHVRHSFRYDAALEQNRAQIYGTQLPPGVQELNRFSLASEGQSHTVVGIPVAQSAENPKSDEVAAGIAYTGGSTVVAPMRDPTGDTMRNMNNYSMAGEYVPPLPTHGSNMSAAQVLTMPAYPDPVPSSTMYGGGGREGNHDEYGRTNRDGAQPSRNSGRSNGNPLLW